MFALQMCFKKKHLIVTMSNYTTPTLSAWWDISSSVHLHGGILSLTSQLQSIRMVWSSSYNEMLAPLHGRSTDDEILAPQFVNQDVLLR